MVNHSFWNLLKHFREYSYKYFFRLMPGWIQNNLRITSPGVSKVLSCAQRFTGGNSIAETQRAFYEVLYTNRKKLENLNFHVDFFTMFLHWQFFFCQKVACVFGTHLEETLLTKGDIMSKQCKDFYFRLCPTSTSLTFRRNCSQLEICF